MKPDKKTCLYCDKQIEGKKLYCSDAHRMAYKRQDEQEPEQKDNPNTNKPEQKVPEQPKSNTFRDSLTKTDKTYYDRAMKDFGEPYYKFNKVPEKTVKCLQCLKEFKTRLSLCRFCSYEHYQEALSGKV